MAMKWYTIQAYSNYENKVRLSLEERIQRAGMEDRFGDMIARAADKAWLDFRAFEAEDHQASIYRSGEVCNAGSFCCGNCNHRLELTKTGELPRCPACNQGEFHRVIG